MSQNSGPPEGSSASSPSEQAALHPCFGENTLSQRLCAGSECDEKFTSYEELPVQVHRRESMIYALFIILIL